jgi:hypothetical protein
MMCKRRGVGGEDHGQIELLVGACILVVGEGGRPEMKESGIDAAAATVMARWESKVVTEYLPTRG